MPYSSFAETFLPVSFSAASPSSATHAFRSEVQVLQCTIATGAPVGVATRSISGYTRLSGCSSTAIANTDVPALTLPVRGATELVAVMPVPASPSGGQSGMPALSVPVGSSRRAPASVSRPASWPATSTRGRMSFSFQG